MNFNPDWDIIQRFDEPIPCTVIDEVTDVLFSPDPPGHVIEKAEICIILGSRNCGYKAKRAFDLFGVNPNFLYIACGANTTESGSTEAEHIRKVLIANGVSPESVLIEGNSKNTSENLLNAEQLIVDGVGEPSKNNIVIVSSWFHRLHVLASLPKSLDHASFVGASGPFAGKDTWHSNPLGRGVVFHELMRPNFHHTFKVDTQNSAFKLVSSASESL